MDDDPITQRRSGVDHHARIDAAKLADSYAPPDHRAGLDASSRADLRMILDNRAGAYCDILAKFHLPANHRRGMNPGRRWQRMEQLGRQGKPQLRLLSFDDALGV